MAKTYQISKNIIFSVNDDGTISRLASIDDSGKIIIEGESPIDSHSNNIWYWIVMIVLFVTCVILIGQYNDVTRERDNLAEELSTLRQTVGDLYPIIITDIEIANIYSGGEIETNYGNTIYSSRTMFLKPRIKYYGIISGDKTLKVKWIKPNGTLSTGSSSPYGFSYSEEDYIYSGANHTLTLNGWGGENQGYWASGNYSIEIWYGNSCLKSKSFTIY